MSCSALMLLSALVVAVNSHASMIMPLSRNAIDDELPAWKDGKYPATGLIEPYSCFCTNGSSVCNTGQSCFWFSQGCTIGCDKCDANGARYPNFDHCPNQSIAATLNDPKYRTANQNASAGSEQDIFKYNPWRAPGKAPVADSCGMAGGSPVEVFNAGAYNATKNAKQGDLGSKVLKYRPTGTVWKRGGIATTRIQTTATHGGGYRFRLCPLESELNEECFQKMELDFANETHAMARFADSSKDTAIPATVVKEGGGIGWMLYPIPNPTTLACDYDATKTPEKHCMWHCPRCKAPWWAADKACPTECDKQYPNLPKNAGSDPHWTPNPLPGHNFHEFAIENTIKVPANIPAGEYVLGWRWDCEMTSQVWTTCADITIE